MPTLGLTTPLYIKCAALRLTLPTDYDLVIESLVTTTSRMSLALNARELNLERQKLLLYVELRADLPDPAGLDPVTRWHDRRHTSGNQYTGDMILALLSTFSVCERGKPRYPATSAPVTARQVVTLG